MPAGHHALCRAIAKGDEATLRTAIDGDPASAGHWKPIMDAAFAGKAALLRILLAAGADPNVVSGTGSRHTPLTRLVQHHSTIPKRAGHEETLLALLESGADPNLAAGPHEFEPLAYAAVAPAQNFIDLLRANGASVGIHLAAALLDRAAVARLLRKKARANEGDRRGRNPLDYVALSGLWKIHGSERALACAEALLDAGANVDGGEQIVEGSEVFHATPLWRALSWQQHYALAELLLERGAAPNPAVFAVTFLGEQRGMDLLDRYGADWEQRFNSRTPLMDLMHFRRPAGSAWLIARGVDVNAVDDDGRTALHYAAMQGVRPDYVRELLDAGAVPDVRDGAGATPLDYAQRKGRSKLIGLLGG